MKPSATGSSPRRPRRSTSNDRPLEHDVAGSPGARQRGSPCPPGGLVREMDHLLARHRVAGHPDRVPRGRVRGLERGGVSGRRLDDDPERIGGLPAPTASAAGNWSVLYQWGVLDPDRIGVCGCGWHILRGRDCLHGNHLRIRATSTSTSTSANTFGFSFTPAST